ncbi:MULTISPECIES: hypothetical protein [unclassified Bradyrhizobium]|uniref:hypothetical protein n=1 Tax=unclassified Bradyrhizobium TaxID=2631580 RepID=UPI001FFBA571|nr:hypothetical protein [Bradyrhizobium sp. 48]MCK1446741.1 hypothetical protein [Bradyrhizobium sp. 48]
MSLDPILLIGGSGVVGRHAARYLRAAAPGVPLLIGGRNLAKARKAAEEVGHAAGVALDLAAPDVGIGDQEVCAVAVLLRDEALSGFRFARRRSLPYIGISTGIEEIGIEVAGFMQDPTRSAMTDLSAALQKVRRQGAATRVLKSTFRQGRAWCRLTLPAAAARALGAISRNPAAGGARIDGGRADRRSSFAGPGVLDFSTITLTRGRAPRCDTVCAQAV